MQNCGIAILYSIILLGLIGPGCTHGPCRYPLADPTWEDCDRNHVPEKPEKYYSGRVANRIDMSVLRPLSRLFAFPLPGEALNVNALDEVPNSAWFTNRIGLHPMTPAETAQGSCTGPRLDGSQGPWVVTGAKPDGANPGFFIKAPSGTYLLKFDGPKAPQRNTAADVIGSKIYHAAGYNAPCNQIVYFRRDILTIGKGAMAKNQYGEKYPVTEKDVDKVLAMAFRLKNGLMRAAASKFLPGKPLGPWKYDGLRSDDPNDIIPHDYRRELRGAFLLSAWINHWDAREQNTLDVWFSEQGRNFIRHYYLDFGDSFGAHNPRLGHTYGIDYKHMFLDFLSLGMIPRPWTSAKITNKAVIFGYFSSRNFVPSEYRTSYPNAAFERMTFRDALWMVRIISRFTDEHMRAIVKTGKFTDQAAEDYLVQTLIERRDLILKEYLTQWAPLDRFRIVRRTAGELTQSFCFEDLAIKHNLVSGENVCYKFRFYGGEELDRELGFLQFRPDPDHPHRSCVVLPIGDKCPHELAPEGSADDHPLRYGVMKVFIHQKPTFPPTSSIWLHFYDLGPERGFKLVGIERQPEPVMPDLY